MTLAFVLVILVVMVGGALGAWATWKWAPTERHCKVWCPVFKQKAEIVAIRVNAESAPPGASLPFLEIKQCSLFGGRLANCRAECLRREYGPPQ